MISEQIVKAVVALTGMMVIASNTVPAAAKERHYEQVRVLLISRMASCVSCHTTAAGTKLNLYGERIAAQPKGTMADRIARLERDAKGGRKQNGDETGPSDRDVDNDGVPNWVEILARKSPANAKEKPDAETAERIRSVVSCHICHKATGLTGQGLAANPHNELGELLARAAGGAKGAAKPKDDREVRKAAERMTILSRLAQVRTKKPKGSAATYWQRLRMLHAPADAKDKVTAEEMKKLKKENAAIKREKKKTPKRGLDCKAHGLDGFLLDGDVLE